MADEIQCFLIEPDSDDPRGKWIRADTGEIFSSPAEAPVGAMWFATWYKATPWENMDGPPLIVRTPGGDWNVDSRASNCTRPEDRSHRCWVRHGTPPNITVDKNGETCGCGCSIGQGPNWSLYHGFLRNGKLIPA